MSEIFITNIRNLKGDINTQPMVIKKRREYYKYLKPKNSLLYMKTTKSLKDKNYEY